jgi:hypothetical protein
VESIEKPLGIPLPPPRGFAFTAIAPSPLLLGLALHRSGIGFLNLSQGRVRPLTDGEPYHQLEQVEGVEEDLARPLAVSQQVRTRRARARRSRPRQ